MGNRYKEVLMTYLRRPFSSWGAGFQLLGGVFWLGLSVMLSKRSVAPTAATIVVFGGTLWFHFREQVVHSNSKLRPGYIGPQVAAFALLSSMLILVIALPLVAASDHESVAPYAIVIFGFGVIGCCATMISLTLLLLIAALLGIPIMVDSSNALSIFLGGGYEATTACLLGAGLIGIIWAAARLLRIAEDDFGYTRPFELDAFSRGILFGCSSQGVADGQPPRELVRALQDANMFGNAAHRHQRRWRVAWRFGSRITWAMYFLALIPVWLVGSTQHLSRLDVVIDAQYMLPALFIMPATLTAAAWLQLWRYTEIEVLRPATRGKFIRSIGKTLFFQCLIQCGIAAVLFLLAVYTVGGGLVGVLLLIPFVMAVLLAQPIVFAAIWWLLSYRQPALLILLPIAIIPMASPEIGRYISVAPLLQIAIMPMASPLFPTADDQSFLLGAAFLMAIGLILIPIIYRHWLNLEIG